MISVERWETTRPNWPRWRRASGGSFPIFRNHWNCRRRRSAVIFSRASPRRSRARAQSRSQLDIVEDLQWADESTLALLIHLANRVASCQW